MWSFLFFRFNVQPLVFLFFVFMASAKCCTRCKQNSFWLLYCFSAGSSYVSSTPTQAPRVLAYRILICCLKSYLISKGKHICWLFNLGGFLSPEGHSCSSGFHRISYFLPTFSIRPIFFFFFFFFAAYIGWHPDCGFRFCSGFHLCRRRKWWNLLNNT